MKRIPVALRWGDLDAYGHINNVAVLRILEEARVRAFWRSSPDAPGILPPLDREQSEWAVVSEISVRYLRPISYAEVPVAVELSVTAVSGASFVIGYRLYADGSIDPDLIASSTVVTVDRDTGAPRRLSSSIREALIAERDQGDD